jgi:hypothetical protein
MRNSFKSTINAIDAELTMLQQHQQRMESHLLELENGIVSSRQVFRGHRVCMNRTGLGIICVKCEKYVVNFFTEMNKILGIHFYFSLPAFVI